MKTLYVVIADDKEEILSKTTPINTKAGRYQPDDDLLAFLKGL